MLLLAIALVLPFCAQAQGNYVYVNNQTAANSVNAYSVSLTGALTPLAGSPYSTGGVGANVSCYGLNRITISGANNFMFVANTGNQTISVFQINPATGALTLVPGSPFASGLTLDNCQGISLAATPDGAFLMASSNGKINTFSISASGALTPFASTPNCCTPMAGMVISANGKFLAVSNENSVSVYTIAAGVLTPVLGSPFPKTGTGLISGLDFSCAGDRLYGGEATGSPTITDGWTVDANGVLTPAPGTPYHTAGNDSNDVHLSPDNTLLFESNQFSNSVNSFNLNVDGSLSNIGKFGTSTSVHVPAGMATDAGGRFLYIADDNFGVAVFRINAGGLLTPLTDNAINRPGEIQDLAAYPPRSCASADLAITKTTGPTVVAGSPIVYTISITNNGPAAASAVVSDTFPAGTTPGGNLKIVAATGAQRVGGVVTIHTTAPHQIFAGEKVSIAAVGDSSFNGTFTVASVPDAFSFTYSQAGPDATSGSGTATTANCQLPLTGGTGVCGGTPSAARTIPIVATTGARRAGGVVTITTTAPHVLLAGQTVTISGVATTSFNGTFPIVSVPTPTTFTYSQAAADATSGGGNVITGQTQIVTFSTLASGETQTALLTTTTSTTVANGTVISNTATIGNKSVVDPVPGNNSSTAAVTVGTPVATTITVPNGTGPYGGLATLTAILTNSVTNAPVPGETLTFQLNGNQASAVTDATGTATVTSLPIGTISVGTHPSAFTVSFGGDSSFLASSAVGTLVVTKAQLTVTADNQSRLYGDPNPPLTYTFSGFVNGDTAAVVSGTADCTTTATPASPVGTYPITCTVGTLTATNYVFVFVDGTLTVNPAPLTVTVANATRAYGDPNPVFTGTITGLKNGDNITATYSTTATITSPVGTYPITATLVDPGNVLGNYTVTNNPGTLTITPAALVVTANNAARLYGDPNPVFTGTIAGIKNGDNITAIYTTTATPASPIGTYPIIPTLTDNGTGALANYTVTTNNGSLTVSPTPLTVTAADATRPYGAPNPVFTGTIVGIKNSDPITATYSTTATATSPAGTYPIVPTLVDPTNVLGNYIVTINNGTLTITQAILTVTAANASMVYGDPLPLLTGTITGIVNGDNITATYSTVATSASPVGTYAIVPTVSDNGTGALANYIVVINNGILTITPAPLTVTAANATRVYGDPNPVFTGAIVGIKNGDNITATFATTAAPTSPVGTYPIVPTLIDPTLKLGNYTVTSINGTLTVTAAPLTVTANNASRLFDTPNPPLSGIITGIKNGDNITATYATTAVTTSPVGTYPITPTLVDPTAKLGNYAVTSNNGTLTVNAAPTGNFVFVNNQAAAGNSISGYSVAADGTLTALAGSPVATGGLGGTIACSSVDRIALSAGNNLLFVSNSGDQSISAFSINPASGALTAVAGSPFASGLTLDACGGISLAASPDGAYLMASSNGQIKTFSIGAGGALSAVSTAANPVVPNASMKISANGQFLAVSNGTSVSLYTINGDGSLSTVAGSPFAETGTGTLAGLDFSSTSGLLYGAEASATSGLTDAWTVALNGVLSAVAGSPFSTTAVNSNAVLLSPDNSLLFASNQGSSNISSFSVSAAGSLTSIGSFGSAASLHAPVGMSTDRSGSLLYVADDTFGVAVFRIGGAGALAQLGDVAIAGAGQVQSLVAYPPRMTSTADVSITAAAGSANVVAGQNVTYTLTVTNNGPDPASVTVTDTLPAGFTVVSCAATGNGACAGTSGVANFYLLQSGETQTVTLVASTSLSIPDGTVTTNTASISNNSAVDPNAANNSASVNVTVAQPITTTLTVAAASGTYGGSTTLSATLKDAASNPVAGKTISFSLNGTAVGSAVTDATGLASIPASLVGINAGTYTGGVTASFAGDPNTKASSGSADLVVNPALLTVTATGATRVYGDPNPTFAFTITGFVNGETSAVLTGSPICTTAATPASAVGAYPITCSIGTLSAANYTFTFVSGTLTITPAPLTVTAANATRVYGDPNPTFTGTITGIKNGDNISAIYATTATATSPVGTYAITAGLVDPTNKLSNYTVTVNNGVLTVSPAPLTVTAANATMVFGGPVPALTGTITGIKNGDNITATYSTTATSSSPVGTYPIVPTLVDPTLKLSNYTVTINNGTLTITNAVLTVTAANASMVYGDPLPVLTGTITGILNGDNITATYTTVATSASPVGTYAIVPVLSDNGTGALANYTVVINNGVLTINPAPLSVTAANTSMIYGDPVPALTGAIVGIKNGDNITATFATTATSASPVGTYPIVPTLIDPTLKLGNYTVTSLNGTLTITAAPLTVTADNASRLFGTPNPPLSGTITGIKNGDNITATYATTAVATSPVGTYPITPTLVDPGAKLGNYAVTSNNGTLTVNAAPTANFLFVNNQAAAGNSIAGYSVAADGTLTALAGSPVATGGLGANAACSSVNRLALSGGSNLLFVSNGGDQSISAFQINPASGALTAVAGSPFASGLTLDACSGISLAATPDGQFLMASSNGQIKTFSIGAGGALTAVSTAANPVLPNAGMKISANGQYLAVSDGTSVAVFTISASGSLTAVAGSPFAKAGTGTLAGLDFSSTSGLLYGAEASATAGLTDAWTVASGGVLSPVAGSPFSTTAINSNVLLLSPANSLLFASNQGSNSVSSFSVAAGGGLTSLGSFGSAASLHAPVGMSTDRSGSLLYVADDTFGVAVFRISGAGSLSQLSDTAISGAGQVQDLVAYPPRIASTADLSVTVAAGSSSVVAGQNVTFTITVTNNGSDPASATITDTLPSGFTLVSCAATGNGACITNSAAANFYLLQSGETQTVTLVASTSLSIPDGTVATNSVSISNSSAVDPNAANNSASVNVTVGQPSTTTLAVAAASGTYGGSTTLSATLSTTTGPLAGQTVSFSLNAVSIGSAVTDATGLASVPASLVGIGAGSYPGAVTASFAGDANNKAASGSAGLTVNPALLTVTASNATRVYGDPNPTFAFAITGFVNGETASVLTGSPSCTTVADPTSAVGTYPITCSTGTLSAANYTFTFVNATLTITPAPLTVTAANASRVYGDPNPAFTGTITGIKNGDNITATYGTTATAASAVGTYPITPTLVDPTSKLGNYTVTSTNGTLTITPAPLTVTAANVTRAYGDPNPLLTGTITGIKNNDNITATYSTTATAASPVGTYAIVPTLVDPTAKLSNYTVTSTNGTLTVSPALLTVTAANASRFYGDPNPVFTGTIAGIKNGDNITATYASAATATSAPGAYAIVPTVSDNGTGALANYTVVINNGVLTVNAAPLTVVADNATRAYGTANPVFTGTITGLKNGDNITASYTSATDATSNVGTYPITPVLSDPTNKLSNYAVTLTNGTLTITPVPLTITAANASRVYGDPNPAFTGTITGLVNGDNITATYTSADPTAAVGTYPIVPTPVDPTGKLGNYTVTLNNGILTVTPAPLSVTAANATRQYGDPNVLSGTITGIKNGDNITATYSTTATATSVPGTYPIVPALVDPTGKLSNYTVTSTNGTLTITPAVLTVTAANASMVYGDPVPALTGTITGIKNGENITATYSTTATSASPVGTYPIVPTVTDNGTGALANYTVVINNGTLTVNPAPLTVTANSFTRLYGDANPTFTGAITGIKNGDNITATFGTVADPTSPVGTYAIVPVLSDPTGKLGNYTVTINNGALLINPAPLSVTAADASRVYGDPNPVFSGTITGIKNGDNITATYASATDPTTTVGNYPIVPTLVDPTGKLSNYVVTSTNGTLTITPAPLTVQANDATRAVGQPDPTFTGTITGIKNADNITATYSTTATATSPAGTYPIIPTLVDPNGLLVNYAVTSINGTLTITP